MPPHCREAVPGPRPEAGPGSGTTWWEAVAPWQCAWQLRQAEEWRQRNSRRPWSPQGRPAVPPQPACARCAGPGSWPADRGCPAPCRHRSWCMIATEAHLIDCSADPMARPGPILRLIVLQKSGISLGLLALALLSAEGALRYERLPDLARDLLDGDHRLLALAVTKGIAMGQGSLDRMARFSALYSIVIGLGAIGTWLGKAWGELLFVLVLISALPFEVRELVEAVTVLHVGLLAVTCFGLALLLRQLRVHRHFSPGCPAAGAHPDG
ncbi:MAG: DUF2127 domain-containing protein [Aphanocapsa feldmannii 288cV]|nr:MAG: DUF2127 domain-containing protein [Aphanocapsa feldmannii 288cV]